MVIAARAEARVFSSLALVLIALAGKFLRARVRVAWACGDPLGAHLQPLSEKAADRIKGLR